jgi:hypothetical protein
MYKIKVAYYLFSLVERDSCNKVTNKNTFHLSSSKFYHPYMCVNGVTKIFEH